MCPSKFPTRRLSLLSAAGVALVSMGCASGLPAVLSATPDQVAVEFKSGDRASVTNELATKKCAEFQKLAQFDEVDQGSTKDTNVAKYDCVPEEGQVAADAKAELEAAKLAADAKIKGETEAARAAAEAVAEAQAAERAAQVPPVAAAPPTEAVSDAIDSATDEAGDAAAKAVTTP